MIKKIPFKTAVAVSLLVLGLTLAFHLLVIIQIIPYTIVWGGRLKTEGEMLRFETGSLLLNSLLMLLITAKAGYLRIGPVLKISNAALWAFAGLFSLNTIGNLFAKMTLETMVFTPVTLILAILCLRIAIEPAKLKENN